jgi:hypothetical protein
MLLSLVVDLLSSRRDVMPRPRRAQRECVKARYTHTHTHTDQQAIQTSLSFSLFLRKPSVSLSHDAARHTPSRDHHPHSLPCALLIVERLLLLLLLPLLSLPWWSWWGGADGDIDGGGVAENGDAALCLCCGVWERGRARGVKSEL